MLIVPVIDIREGVAVRAVAGRRDDYRPLRTRFASTSAAERVARGFRTLHPFTTLYIADLDAIEGRGDNRTAIDAVAEALPDVDLWVDAGRARVEAMRSAARRVRVVGSESLADDAAAALRCQPPPILSLDFRDDAFLGPPALLSSSDLWPQRLIVMTLARVGMREGPAFSLLGDIIARAGDRSVFAAGGVRGVEDLVSLRACGAAGALVSTALHEGRLTAKDLARLDAL